VSRDWLSLHAFHHGDLDALLMHAVRPLLARLRADRLLDRYFFLRYWDGGPHLRLRLLPPPAVDAADVERLAVAWLRGYLAEHPAPDLPAIADYPRFAPALAGREGVDGYLPHPLPNNSVHAIAYVPEVDRYGDGESLAAVEAHFAESSRIALGLVCAGAGRRQRHTAALCAVMLGWRAQGTTPPQVTDPELDRSYAAGREALRELAGQVARIADGTSTLPHSGALRSWWRSLGPGPVRRVADLCAHLLCNRLGLTYTDERNVRRLAARTVADHKVGAR